MPLFKKHTPAPAESTKTNIAPVGEANPGDTARFGTGTVAQPPAGEADTNPRIAATAVRRPDPFKPAAAPAVEQDRTVLLRSAPQAEAAPPERAPEPGPAGAMPGAVAAEPPAPAAPPVPVDDGTPLAFIIERNGANAGTGHCLGAETILGRAQDAQVYIASDAASKRHANIRYRDGAFVFWDLASANYSFLVGEDGERTRILQPHRLTDGDTLELGDARVTFLEIRE